MLSEEDKKDVIENKANYTLDEIKAKLAVICYDKKINLSSEENTEVHETEEDPVVTFSFNDDNSSLPDWVKAVKNFDEENN